MLFVFNVFYVIEIVNLLLFSTCFDLL